MADDNSPPQWPTGAGISESEAAARLDSLNESPNDAPPPRERPEREEDPGNAQPEGNTVVDPDAESGERGDEGDDAGNERVDEREAAAGEGEDAPDFWSAEDKAWWKQVPPELRPVLKKYEEQRIEFANRKAEEAAAERRKAMEEVQKLGSTSEQYAAWWQQNAQKFEQTFVNRWAGVDFNKLAADNPAEWARLSQMRADEHTMLTQAANQAQEAQKVTQQRQKQQLDEFKVAEHAKVAKKLPDYFGTPEKSAKTYEDLGKFLFSKGIPAERINTIHEAPIIEMALNAMRFEQAQKRASAVTSSGTGNNPGNAAPKRIEPGPAQQRGNRNGEAIRQASERLNKSGGYDTKAAMELIRLRGL
jgi:hypothetical protein